MVGFYSPDVLVNDAKRHGLNVLPPHINYSDVRCTLEDPITIRLGLAYIQGLGAVAIFKILIARRDGRFLSLPDFCRRTHLPRLLVENLIKAKAMPDWGDQRKLIWTLGQIRYDEALDFVWPDEEITLPPLTEAEQVFWEYETLGVNTGQHILALYRLDLQRRGVSSSHQLKLKQDGASVITAGLVIVRQRPPTAKGFVFVSLEDEEGVFDLILNPAIVTHTKKLPKRQDYGLNKQILLLVEGTVQRSGNTVNILAIKLQPLLSSTIANVAAAQVRASSE